jgi:acyl-CoA reductase-like NAD-dependent aldehyde dehydrogenase
MSAPRVPLMLASDSPAADVAPVRAPWDLSVIAEIERGDARHVEDALATAQALFGDRDRWLPKVERHDILRRAAGLIRERRKELALEAAREGGKPLVDSLVEVDRAVNSVELCARTLADERGSEIPMDLNAASTGRLAFTTHEPIGPVVAISAFNHPLNLIAHQVGPAVAAGCPVVVKPAGDTPISCMRFLEILREAGLPPEWAQGLVTTDLDVAQALATDSRVGFLTFIGSSRVGWMLRGALAPGVRCALEHGGAAPVIVGPDADLDDLVSRLAKGGLYHAGQVCVSVQRVLAHRSLADELTERLGVAAEAAVVGDPTRADTEIGPLIRPREVDRVEEWVDEAVAEGAGLVAGGERISETTYAPTLLRDAPSSCRVETQEIFGPVMSISAYDDLDMAIERANALPFPFQAAVFGRDIDMLLRAARRLDAASVLVNDHTAFRVDWMPFAGLREAGLGVGGIPYTFADMRVEKLIVLRSDGL